MQRRFGRFSLPRRLPMTGSLGVCALGPFLFEAANAAGVRGQARDVNRVIDALERHAVEITPDLVRLMLKPH